LMGTRRKVTVSVQPAKYRLTGAERRLAQIASISTKQADLKQEAAERRAARASKAPAASTPRKAATTSDSDTPGE
jgi:hypothetical protein